MKRNRMVFFKSPILGLLESVLLYFDIMLITSACFANVSVSIIILLCVLSSSLMGIVHYFMIRKETIDSIIKTMFFSCMLFVLFFIVFFFLFANFRFRLFPLGNNTAADGFLVMLYMFVFVVSMLIVKILVASLLVTQIQNSIEKTEDENK